MNKEHLRVIANHYYTLVPADELPVSLRETVNNVAEHLGGSGDTFVETTEAWLLNKCQAMTYEQVIEILKGNAS